MKGETNWISRLVANHRPGFSLEQAFYTDPGIYERDLERAILPYWLFLGHQARISHPGDYFLVNVSGESIIVTRDGEGKIHALANVCRHRGSRICLQNEGYAKSFVCPYHAWAYASDGSLLAAKYMPADFDRSEFGLLSYPVQTIEGLIFTNLSDDPEPFDQVVKDGTEYLGLYGLADAKIASRMVWEVEANWKLVMENFRECYHCAPTHPEYCSVMEHGLGDESDMEFFNPDYATYDKEWRKQNHELGRLSGMPKRIGSHRHRCGRYPIQRGYLTQSEGGGSVAPLMGDFNDYDGGNTTLSIYPLHFTSACCDHATAFRFTPLEIQKTEVELTWLVARGAVEGRDYDVEKLTWMWQITTEQDKKIVDDNQSGVNSRSYRPGPLSKFETDMRTFLDWYLERIG